MKNTAADCTQMGNKPVCRRRGNDEGREMDGGASDVAAVFLCPRSQSGSRRGQRYLVGTGTDGSPAGKPMAGTPVFC